LPLLTLPSSAWSKALDPDPSSDLAIMALYDSTKATSRGYVMTMRRRSRIGTSERLKGASTRGGFARSRTAVLLEYYSHTSHPARDARNNLALICCRDTPHTLASPFCPPRHRRPPPQSNSLSAVTMDGHLATSPQPCTLSISASVRIQWKVRAAAEVCALTLQAVDELLEHQNCALHRIWITSKS
jgi:hypothetical protein